MCYQYGDVRSNLFELEKPKWIRHVESPADFGGVMAQNSCSDNGANEAEAELAEEQSEMQRSSRVNCPTPMSWRSA